MHKHIVSVSSGVPSAVTAARVIDRHGHECVDLVFADTRWEDDDNYRFLADVETYLEHEIIRLVDGRQPLDIAEDEHIIPNQKIHPCTYRLKVDQIETYCLNLLRDGYQVTIHIGFDYRDAKPRADKPDGRLGPTRCAYEEKGIGVDFPLLWQPVEYDPLATIRSWNIEPPRMYRLGYRHANCGGRCVAQGQGDWRRTLLNFPKRFAEVEAWERRMRTDERFADYAILRDQSNGEVTPKTLEELRIETEQADEHQMTLFELIDDMSSTCNIECGIGVPDA